jgi:hypothetical protein
VLLLTPPPPSGTAADPSSPASTTAAAPSTPLYPAAAAPSPMRSPTKLLSRRPSQSSTPPMPANKSPQNPPRMNCKRKGKRDCYLIWIENGLAELDSCVKRRRRRAGAHGDGSQMRNECEMGSETVGPRLVGWNPCSHLRPAIFALFSK